MKFIKTILTFFLFSFLFLSCDPSSTIKYEIINKTADSLSLKYKFVFNASGDTSAKSMTILADSSKVINIDYKLGYTTQFDKSHDSIFLYYLTILKKNKLTKLNFKDKKYWKFYITDTEGLDGTYKLIVDSTFFSNN